MTDDLCRLLAALIFPKLLCVDAKTKELNLDLSQMCSFFSVCVKLMHVYQYWTVLFVQIIALNYEIMIF